MQNIILLYLLNENETNYFYMRNNIKIIWKKLEKFYTANNFKEEFDENAASRDEFLAYVHEFVFFEKGKNFVIVDDGKSSSAFANILAINKEGTKHVLCWILSIVKHIKINIPLNMETIQKNLDGIANEINQPDITLQRVEELNEIL